MLPIKFINNYWSTPDPNDLVIVIIGPIGAGKSNFINHLTGNAEQGRAVGLKPHTKKVIPYPIMYHGRRVVLVDTPGLDDTINPDATALRTIHDQLKRRCGTSNIAGIVYLHKITDKRVSGSAASVDKNLHKLAQLCGNMPLRRARLVTTMWDRAKDRAEAETRENELKFNLWRRLLDQGAVAERFDNTRTRAWDIVNGILDNNVRTGLWG